MKPVLLFCLILLEAAAGWAHAAHRRPNWATSATSTALKAIADKAAAPGLKSGSQSRRQLAQEAASDCVWKNDACYLNKDVAMKMLDGASSPLSGFVRALYRCADKASYESCNADEWCRWAGDECAASDEYPGYEPVAHCLGKGSVFLQIPDMVEACKSVDSNGLNGCQKNMDGCRINEKEECDFDFWMYTVGVPSGKYGLQGFSKATVHLVRYWTQSLVSDLPFLLSTNASRYLDWTPPKADCPTGVAQLVCDYAEPLGVTFATSLFCQNRYAGDLEGCAEDQRCTKQGSNCAPSASVITEVTKMQIQVLIDNSPDYAKFFDILLPYATCPAKVQQTCGGKCEWDHKGNQCNPSQNWIFQQLAAVTRSSTDPRCKLLTTLFASGCPASSNPKCAANPKCSWNMAVGECELSKSELTAVLRSIESDLRTVLLKQEECDSHREQSTCL